MPEVSIIQHDPDVQICFNCINYEQIPDEEAGRCKYNAPLVLPMGFYQQNTDLTLYVAQWPIVHAVDSCGKFLNKNIPEIEEIGFIDKVMGMFRGEK